MGRAGQEVRRIGANPRSRPNASNPDAFIASVTAVVNARLNDHPNTSALRPMRAYTGTGNFTRAGTTASPVIPPRPVD